MLSSISPLGERSRGTSFTRTAVAYVVGSTLSAMAAGSVLGGIGSLVPDEIRGSAPVLAALAAMFVVGLVLDVRSGGHGVPSWRRQVDREWIGRYRGWVTGLGFGLQLGLGFVTISTSTSMRGHRRCGRDVFHSDSMDRIRCRWARSAAGWDPPGRPSSRAAPGCAL